MHYCFQIPLVLPLEKRYNWYYCSLLFNANEVLSGHEKKFEKKRENAQFFFQYFIDLRIYKILFFLGF